MKSLAVTMLSNLYLIPHLLEKEIEPYPFQHFMNFAEKNYLDYLPQEVFEKITDDEKQWIHEVYYSEDVEAIRNRHIEISIKVDNISEYEVRKKLLDEDRSLLKRL